MNIFSAIMRSWIFVLCVFIAPMAIRAQIPTKVFEIERILVDGCDGGNEGKNEMVIFQIGPNPVDVNDLRVDGAGATGIIVTGKWPNPTNIYRGISPPPSNPADVASINSTITSCGLLIEPTGGILPAGEKILLITSTAFNPVAHSFADLGDTLYVIFQNAGNTQGHFVNYDAASSERTLVLKHVPTGDGDTIKYDRSLLLNQAGVPGAQDGAVVSYTWPGIATYVNYGCQAPFEPLNPAWDTPDPICSNAAPLNLDSLITGYVGGVWSGTGVSGHYFDPFGLSGIISVTYTVGNPPCEEAEAHDIQVVTSDTASWDSIPPVCEAAGDIDLSTFITGTTGGTWSGSGVSGNMFNPSGLSGTVNITYTVGAAPCIDSEMHSIQVVQSNDAAWTPPDTLCQSSLPIDLNTLIDGTPGGIWSGSGVSGNSFDPTGLSGNISIIYSVGTPPCDDSDTNSIFVLADADASWTPPSPLCQFSSPLDLNSLIDGTTGGSWSGSGVSGNTFDPAGLSGNISITYIAGISPCDDSQTHDIQVIASEDPSWDSIAVMCQSGAPVDLSTLITGSAGGTWSGTGVSGSSFDPAGLSGLINITYTVGASPCLLSETHGFQVVIDPSAAWTSPGNMCHDAATVNLNQLITGTTGGIWTGNGVSDSIFDPASAQGSVTITYQVGNSPCTDLQSHSFDVIPDVDASWIPPSDLCSGDSTLNLSTLLSGTTGGTWSGNGVSGNLFDPSGLSGNVSVTYSVGTSPCEEAETHEIAVGQSVDASWSSPGSICSSSGVSDLTTFVTGNPGGIWKGQGVTGDFFDPMAVTGSSTIWYVIYSGNCSDSVSQTITIDQMPDASWLNPGVLCLSDLPVDLNSFVSGTSGGIFSGIGVSGNYLTYSGNVDVVVTYSVQNGSCTANYSNTIEIENTEAIFSANQLEGEVPLLVEFTNSSTGYESLIWSFGDGDTSGTENPTHSYNTEGEFSTVLYVFSAQGCTDSATIDVTVSNSLSVFYPNAFTPNDDHINDIFGPSFSAEVQEYECFIFNRWGENIYSYTDQYSGWDGTRKGAGKVPTGVYTYLVNFQFKGVLYSHLGIVTVIF
ncbi:MAG: gliding motility-associated C-terminal domain-containing protein [Bacteroidetes bacterium]|nr:gliding motility-associated C-terminal domain-containing protein [Bacteroidota bacterium]MBU1718349.1 gliding motility-associated C-terminal domain-containing protein [Bacteroidota bacterium]